MECGTLSVHSKNESYWLQGKTAFHSVEGRLVLENETGHIEIPMKRLLQLQLLMLQEIRNDVQSAWFLREFHNEVGRLVSDYFENGFNYKITHEAFHNKKVVITNPAMTSKEHKAKFLYWAGKFRGQKQYRKLRLHLGCPCDSTNVRSGNVCGLCNNPPEHHTSGYVLRTTQILDQSLGGVPYGP